MNPKIADTLTDKKVFETFMKAIKEYKNEWVNALKIAGGDEKKALAIRLKILQKLVRYLAESIGVPVPDVVLKPSSDKEVFEGTPDERKFTIGVFAVKDNTIYFNQERISVFTQGKADNFDSRTVEDDFYKVASKIYHETRHAEQCFRGVQYSIQVLNKKPGNVSNTITSKAKSTPLPSSRMAFAQQMYTDYFITDNIPYEQQPKEVDAYMISKSVYRGLHDNKPPKVNSGKDWNADAFSYIDSLPPLDKKDFEYSKSIKLTKNAQCGYDVYFGNEKRNVPSIRDGNSNKPNLNNKPNRNKDADRAIIKSYSYGKMLEKESEIAAMPIKQKNYEHSL
jgi:hypothetical protein